MPDRDAFVRQKLLLRWALPDDRWPTDADEAAARRLADAIEPLVEASGLGQINGYEFGAGEIDILVFGTDTDADIDQLYDLIVPAFRGFGCPRGSRIVRSYRERNEQLESDVVA